MEGHYVVVPDEAARRWYSPALLYGDILRLSRQGACTASNQFFAQRYGVSTDTIRRGLRELKAAGLLRTEPVQGKNARGLLPCTGPAGCANLPGEGVQICGSPPAKMHTPNIRKKEYSRNTARPGPKGAARPEQSSYTLAELEAMNLR